MSPRIVLLAATGYTGRLVAAELAAGPDDFVLTARSADRVARLGAGLGGAPTAVVDVTRPESLRATIAAGDVVINCAGPFTELGEPVVKAAIQAGAHYLDTTGEQRFMHRIERQYHAAAREAGVAVVNAMAFEFALGDAACALAAAGLEGVREIDVVYGIGSMQSSRGTRRSVLRVLATRGLSCREGELREEPTGARRRRVTLDGRERRAVSFPAGEVLTVPRYLSVRRVDGWMLMGARAARWLPRLAPAVPAVARLLIPLADPLLSRGPDGPTPEQRRQSRFTIRAEAVAEDGRRSFVTVEGTDPYGVTAAIVVAGARRALTGPARTGVLAPSQLVEPAALLNGLADRKLEWRRSPVPAR